MSKRTLTSRIARIVAWISVGGTVMAASSCELTIQEAVLSAFSEFLNAYISALLQQFLPGAA